MKRTPSGFTSGCRSASAMAISRTSRHFMSSLLVPGRSAAAEAMLLEAMRFPGTRTVRSAVPTVAWQPSRLVGPSPTASSSLSSSRSVAGGSEP